MLNRKHISRQLLNRLAIAIFGDGRDEARLWEIDPLAHPALSAMTPDQLADLPLGPERKRPRACWGFVGRPAAGR